MYEVAWRGGYRGRVCSAINSFSLTGRHSLTRRRRHDFTIIRRPHPMADKNQAAPEIYEGKIVALIGGASNQNEL
jgi:hypothetical protein